MFNSFVLMSRLIHLFFMPDFVCWRVYVISGVENVTLWGVFPRRNINSCAHQPFSVRGKLVLQCVRRDVSRLRIQPIRLNCNSSVLELDIFSSEMNFKTNGEHLWKFAELVSHLVAF